MNKVSKGFRVFVTVTAACGFVTGIGAQNADAQLRRPLRQERARANNDAAKSAAVYGATTTPADRYANQVQHQANQENRQNNWDNKNENQKMVDYNAATIHHSNVQATQAAQKEALSSRASEASANGGRKRFTGRHR